LAVEERDEGADGVVGELNPVGQKRLEPLVFGVGGFEGDIESFLGVIALFDGGDVA
jgi:hypothetical protein